MLTGFAGAVHADTDYDVISCPLQLTWDGEVEGETFECGIVAVPESHYDPYGRQLELLFLRLNATTLAPRSDPLIYLSGGPGSSALHEVTTIKRIFDNMGPVRERRDVIFFDQRGTGHSNLLTCGPVSAAISVIGETMDLPGATLEDLAALKEQGGVDLYLINALCAAAYKAEGVDVGRYNSVESSHDISALATALGYEGDYNLYGTSYGTRLSLNALRETPERIRSVILDGVAGPEISGTAQTSTKVRHSYDTIFEACSADAFCSAKYPDIRNRFIAVLENLATEPFVFDPPLVGNPIVRGRFPVLDEITPEFFADFAALNNGIQGGGYGALLPALVVALENGDDAYFRKVLGGEAPELTPAPTPATIETAFEADDGFAAPTLEILHSIANNMPTPGESSLAVEWTVVVVNHFIDELRQGVDQSTIIEDMFDFGMLRANRADAATLKAFADTHLSPERARIANALADAMTTNDLRKTMWEIEDIAQEMSGYGERSGNPGMAVAILYGMNCMEEINFTPLSYVEELIATTPYPGVILRDLRDYRLTQAICEFWPKPFEEAEIHAPVESDTPALVMTQGMDTQTAVVFGEQAASRLPNSFYAEFVSEGHVILGRSLDSCPSDITAVFLDDPSSEPDMSCASGANYQLRFEGLEALFAQE